MKNMRKVARFTIRSEGNIKPGNRTRLDIPPDFADMVLVFSHRGSNLIILDSFLYNLHTIHTIHKLDPNGVKCADTAEKSLGIVTI